MARPLAIDLYCGLGGWSEGALAEGYDCIGFDIERHAYGEHRYPGSLVIQDVLTLHGSQFRDSALIVASPPCQAYSYRAMPWSRAKALPPPDNSLFDACFRIQREAIAAAGRHIPLIVENVRGAQPWVGRARWAYGSFYLWGDVPALMPSTFKRSEKGVGPRWDPSTKSGAHGMARWTNPSEGFKSQGLNWSDRTRTGQDFTRVAGNQAMALEGVKVPQCGAPGWFFGNTAHPLRTGSSGSPRRKEASAMIAKIPLPLSRYIAKTFRP